MSARVFAAAAALFLAFPLPIGAVNSHVKVELIPEAAVVSPGDPFWVCVRLTMDPGWHTYWINPGDSGAPTRIKWNLPPGFTASPIEWPFPSRIVLPPLVSFGYEGDAPLMVRITPPAGLRPDTLVRLEARVDWLECEELCVPGDATVAATVTVGPRTVADPARAAFFSEVRARLPMESGDWTVTASRGNGFIRLRAVPPAWFDGRVAGAEFFPDQPGLFQYAATDWRLTGNGYEIDIYRSDISTAPVTRLSGVLVSRDGWRGAGSERALRVAAPVEGVAGPPAAAASRGFLAAIGLAFLGGMILNLMPCVLPVLSIKVLSLIGQADAPAGARLRNAGAYAGGVLIAFLALAGALMALRAGGEQLGWGFQLQSPPVVAALASLFFLMALNMFGVFEIGLSLTRFAGTGGEGPASAFSSGLLATVVATPCTAPFMGSALGFALTQPTPAALAVFAALGAGMATPFVALAASPRLLRFLPRPGAWMESLKQGLGFLLAATVVWLAWVLGQQAGADAIVVVLSALLVQGLGAWIYGRWTTLDRRPAVRRGALVAAALLIGAGVFAAVSMAGSARPGQAAAVEIGWEPYSDERVNELRAQGKPLFIDFGAAWCLTCQVNERVALASGPVAEKFREKGVVTMKADWTSRDPSITAALGRLGRSGVPTYALYDSTPDSPPVILPEILTPGIVVDALDKIR